jgi:hypothetical protein
VEFFEKKNALTKKNALSQPKAILSPSKSCLAETEFSFKLKLFFFFILSQPNDEFI